MMSSLHLLMQLAMMEMDDERRNDSASSQQRVVCLGAASGCVHYYNQRTNDMIPRGINLLNCKLLHMVWR